MKFTKRIAAALGAAIMAACSMTTLTASAATVFYQPYSGERFTLSSSPYTVYHNNSSYVCQASFSVVYRGKKTDDFNLTQYSKTVRRVANGKTYRLGDVNMNGVFDLNDLNQAKKIAALYIAGKDPTKNGYTVDQCWLAAVTSPNGYEVSSVDVQILNSYIIPLAEGNVAVTSKLPDTIEKFVLSDSDYSKWLKLDYLTYLSRGKYLCVNVNCPNTWRNYFPFE